MDNLITIDGVRLETENFWFLLRASTVVGDRVQHFDDILEEKFFKALESLFFEKDNPLETKDEEFENVFSQKFSSFTSRMWLDYCDENNTVLSERMSFPIYCEKYNDWLDK